jgi:UDP:flavonoid glycosyltransferase YjiC (YdhE family)
VVNELNELMRQPFYARRAIEVSRKLQQEDGPARAAELIEQVLSGTPNSNEELVHASGR